MLLNKYLIGYVLVMVLVGCSKEQPNEVIEEVVTAKVKQFDVPLYGNYVARTDASLDVEVRARITGFVESVEFVEGSWVDEGDLLYTIDDRPYRAKLNRVKAALQKDQAALAKAKRDVTRLKPLYEQDAASQLDYDNAISIQEQAQASLSATQAELEETKLELEYTRITAPISGMVGSSEADLGALVGTNGISLLTTIQQIDPIYVNFNMSALDYLNAKRRMNSLMDQLQAEQKGKALEGFVRISLPDGSEYRYWGDVSFTDPKISPKTGTFKVRAQLPNPDSELLPGQYTKARIKLSQISNAIVVPEEATQVEQGGIYVMVVLDSGAIERRFIVVEHYGEQGIVVSGGLSAGELVVVKGLHRIRHGQQVKAISLEEFEKHQLTPNADHQLLAPDKPAKQEDKNKAQGV
ncbi:efflux RND transporter periplasmic adaptor subunit [Pseudoalteromonas sp. MEBiC 03607]|uniref:efflux RND transporter periplasmic adaptor subunit n=1 Tax=Pseudoalteromonas sp. MEBiC 03607 TaxID=2563601 RepID=UPI0010934C82|nr:efflux RND transporter periplasmic adaptor subunit [Pseudoalteromonas sp. MEBiC 03607]TGV21602.1 efflux RND transporter periplasmic adaptor subunit [Pseudoalteromonas sp. MEBiC 03607]